jgi:acetyl esterase/lipase
MQAKTTRSRISIQAWIVLKIMPLFAPDLSSDGALQRVIAQDRARGAALPTKGLRKRIVFGDEMRGTDRVFRVAPRSGVTSPLRLLYLHGGAFVLDLQPAQWNLVWSLIMRTNAAVVVPIFPLAPEHGWRDGLAMVMRVYLELVKESGAHNIVIVSDSAGGGLALSLAHALRDAALPAPAALVMFSPWLDVSVTGADQPELQRRDPVLTIEFLREAGRMWAKDIPTNDPRVSPLFGRHEGLPPTIVFSGTRDILDSDAKRFAAAANKVTLREYPGMMHVWPVAPIPEGRRALDEAVAFINQHVTTS